ncbi:hypothetical protein [Pseudoalteromonas luteoviolacea]|uniref:Uncharacterized protein n=1 Tax=Pseudoalteromonas luteoviolacea S4060-1 TaxID=1365257 RepID=A0A161YNI0_9GAMM|nr:hypothetical protein [Pseudoalteromonas luteoviolacea]KZN63359.1 hypothetical protein N478_03660 [Pseudoalteromonas luteoviolacea S4060-1]
MTKKKSKKRYSDIVMSVLAARPSQELVAEPIRKAIDTVYRYIEEPLTLKSLEKREALFSTSQKRVRVKVVRLVITLLSYTDFASLRVGVAKSKCLDPVFHRRIMQMYKKIFNEEISRAAYFRYLRKLVRAGYFCTQAMNIAEIDDSGERVIRGKGGYKWFTWLFFRDLNFESAYFKEQRRIALNSLKKSNRVNTWPVWKSRVAREAALLLQKVEAHSTSALVGEYDTHNQLNIFH